jgi:hypothetical protein
VRHHKTLPLCAPRSPPQRVLRRRHGSRHCRHPPPHAAHPTPIRLPADAGRSPGCRRAALIAGGQPRPRRAECAREALRYPEEFMFHICSHSARESIGVRATKSRPSRESSAIAPAMRPSGAVSKRVAVGAISPPPAATSRTMLYFSIFRSTNLPASAGSYSVLATAQESELAMIPASVIYCRLRLWRLRRLPFVSRRLQRGDGVKRNFKPPKVDEKHSRCQ